MKEEVLYTLAAMGLFIGVPILAVLLDDLKQTIMDKYQHHRLAKKQYCDFTNCKYCKKGCCFKEPKYCSYDYYKRKDRE